MKNTQEIKSYSRKFGCLNWIEIRCFCDSPSFLADTDFYIPRKRRNNEASPRPFITDAENYFNKHFWIACDEKANGWQIKTSERCLWNYEAI